MTRIAFIGLGNMGGGMAARLVGAGHADHCEAQQHECDDVFHAASLTESA